MPTVERNSVVAIDAPTVKRNSVLFTDAPRAAAAAAKVPRVAFATPDAWGESTAGGDRDGGWGKSTMGGLGKSSAGGWGKSSAGGDTLSAPLLKPRRTERGVIAMTQDWGELSDSDDSDDEVPAANDRRERYARLMRAMESEADEVEGTSKKEEQKVSSGCRMGLVNVFFFVIFNVGTAALLLLGWYDRCWLAVFCLAPATLLIASIEVYLAMTDRFVVRARHALRHRCFGICVRPFFEVFVVIFFGLLHAYPLLLAYRHCVDSSAQRTFLTELETFDPSRRNLAQEMRYDSHALVLWAVPMLVSLTWLLAHQHSDMSLEELTLWASLLFLAAVTVAVAAVEFDYTASQHVRLKYGMVYSDELSEWERDPKERSQSFVAAHPAYRALEVIQRTLVLATAALYSDLCPLGMLALAIADYGIGVFAICRNSRPSAKVAVLSVPVFVINILYYVDEPGYALLALHSCRIVDRLRFLEFLGAAVALAYGVAQGMGVAAFADAHQVVSVDTSVLLLAALLVGFVSSALLGRSASKIGVRGDDIFTAIARKDVEAMKVSLSFKGGCSVNMRIMDDTMRTPLHVAVTCQSLECAQQLVRGGADVNLVDSRGENPLHAACRLGDNAFADALLESKSDFDIITMLNAKNDTGMTPLDVLSKSAPKEMAAKLADKKQPQLAIGGQRNSELRPMRKVNFARGSVGGPERRVSTGPAPRSSMRSTLKRSSTGMSTTSDVSNALGRNSLFGDVVGGQHFHVWAGPREQFAGEDLVALMFSRGIGEQLQRLLEDMDQSRKQARIQLSNLETQGVLGAGAFGKVIKVQDVRTGEVYAMKLQKKDHAAKCAMREARALHQDPHPFIVGLAHVFHTTLFFGIILEFCDKDLNARLVEFSAGAEKVTGLPQARAIRYTVCVMLALEHLHQQKIVFRDLKPENVLTTSEDQGAYAKLTDFGLARTLEDDAPGADGRRERAASEGRSAPPPRLTIKVGTPAFMSQETFTDFHLDSDSGSDKEEDDQVRMLLARDWYALGCCFMLLLLGEDGGRKYSAGSRVILLPPPEHSIPEVLARAHEEKACEEDAFQILSALTETKVSERASSREMRESPMLQDAVAELEELVLADAIPVSAACSPR